MSGSNWGQNFSQISNYVFQLAIFLDPSVAIKGSPLY